MVEDDFSAFLVIVGMMVAYNRGVKETIFVPYDLKYFRGSNPSKASKATAGSGTLSH